ncbi:hypothetical protein D3C80_2019390 [compost metagenome]
MRKKRAVDRIDLVLGREFFDDFCTAFGVGTIVFNDNFQRASVNAAFVVDDFGSGLCNTLIPATVGCADAGAVELHADLDRFRSLRL